MKEDELHDDSSDTEPVCISLITENANIRFLWFLLTDTNIAFSTGYVPLFHSCSSPIVIWVLKFFFFFSHVNVNNKYSLFSPLPLKYIL